MHSRKAVAAIAVALALPAVASAEAVTIPAGTKLMGELDQQVTSNTRKFDLGDLVRGHVWRNVVVDGHTVIAAGAPLMLRVSDISKRRIAGRGGDVEIQAVSVTAIDGTEIFLDGGYDKQASHRTALSASLSALVFWPAIFIRGKEAVLEPGTIFDASIPANTYIDVPAGRARKIRIDRAPDLSAEVLYDEIDENARRLPMRVTVCDKPWPEDLHVATVNDQRIDAISFETASVAPNGACQVGTGDVDLKALSEHFRRGINRFTIESQGGSAEVVLDIEM